MFDKIINRYKINKYSMIKNGTIAVITMFGVGMLFGTKNIMLAFPIALTSIVLGRRNFGVKPISKILRITAIDLTIVSVAFLSTINMYLGIPINFVAMFLIMYIIVTPNDPTFYKPFIMLYVFSQYAAISLEELPLRLLSIVFGVVVVLVCNTFMYNINEKKVLGNNVVSTLKLLSNQISNICNKEYDEDITKNITNKMRDMAYKIYVTRYRRYLTTNLGQIQFKIFLSLEHLNLFLIKIYNGYISGEFKETNLKDLEVVINSVADYVEGVEYSKKIEETITWYINKYRNKDKYSQELCNIFICLLKNIHELTLLDDKKINVVYKEWERSDMDKFKVTFKEYFNKGSIRFKFAMRMSITLTFAIFVGETLGFYKVIWAIITVMSIMQPYYEDTIAKSRERVRGNILAILFTGVFINVVNVRWVTIAILIMSLYLLYGFKEYDKISLFAGIASISIASLTTGINQIVFYRVIYVIVGVIVVILANKIIFPYKLKDGISQLVDKIKRYNNMLLTEGKEYLNNKGEEHKIRDIIITSTLMSQKLYLRNLQYGDEKINEFLDQNNRFIIEIGYKILLSYGKNYNFQEILDLYKELNVS